VNRDRLPSNLTPKKRIYASPMVKRLCQEHGIDISLLTPSSPDGQLTKADVDHYILEQGKGLDTKENIKVQPKNFSKLKVSPMAKRIADGLKIDLAQVPASNGIRVMKEDVLAYKQSTKEDINPDFTKPRESRRELLSGIRKVIADRMVKSYFTYPTVTQTMETDMKAFEEFRVDFNSQYDQKDYQLSITDLILASVAKALRDHEIINASIDGSEIVYHADINIGVAVGTLSGLLVVVVRNADTLSLKALAAETKRLIRAAREAVITMEEMKGGTFTITNMGMEGIDSFNPIINYPESAILGVGRIIEKPVVINGGIMIRPRMVLSLTHDHRIIDGIPASAFLRSVVNILENPYVSF
jgi:pyruvate dehydrogenase E2 component (dihydrolipoamide acetyltransferase)